MERQSYLLHPENTDGPKVVAEVVPMSEGDLIVGLRKAGDHPDGEFAIVIIAPQSDGTVVVKFYDGDTGDLGIEDVVLASEVPA